MKMNGIFRAEIAGQDHSFFVNFDHDKEGTFLVMRISITEPFIPNEIMTHALSVVIQSADPANPVFRFEINPLVQCKYTGMIAVDGSRYVQFKPLEIKDLTET
jgi:hypothetical protein